MVRITRRKVQINSTVSPYLAKELDEGLESDDYSSQSDAVSIALAEHFIRKEQREKERKMAELYAVLIKNKEGRCLLDEVPRTQIERADALTKAGIALVEAGHYEEAKKCFAKAKKLEAISENERPKHIIYNPQKEKEECMEAISSEPRELTQEEARKAAEAKEYYKTLLGDHEIKKEGTISELLKKQ